MSYFLANHILKIGTEQTITGEEVVHIAQARRIKVGEHINLQGPDLRRFNTQVITVNRHTITVKVLEEIEPPPEPTLKVILFQALVHEQALDYILQKSTELGAATIVIFPSANTPTQFHGERLMHKLERWQKITLEAAKQCDRLLPPTIEFLGSFEEATARAQNCSRIFVLDSHGTQTFSQLHNSPQPPLTLRGGDRSIPPLSDRGGSALGGKIRGGEGGVMNDTLALFVGPEGGFTTEEFESLKALPHATAVRMGPRILRTETAATSAIAIVQTLWGDM